MVRKTERSIFVFTALLVLAVGVMAAPRAYAGAAETWLNVSLLNISTPASTGHDSFVLQGSFNLPPQDVVESMDVTLQIDSTWSLLLSTDSWLRVAGEPNTFKARKAGVVARIKYWVGGSSKCEFKFTASRQTLKDKLPDGEDLSVRLVIGNGFNETADCRMKVHRRLRTLIRTESGPEFLIKKVRITRNLAKPNADTLLFEGRVHSEEQIDPAASTIVMTVGPLVITIPEGGMVLSGKYFKFRGTLAGGEKVSVTVNTDTGKLVVLVTKADFSALTPETTISLVFSGGVDVGWGYLVTLRENDAQSVYKY